MKKDNAAHIAGLLFAALNAWLSAHGRREVSTRYGTAGWGEYRDAAREVSFKTGLPVDHEDRRTSEQREAKRREYLRMWHPQHLGT